MQLPADTVKAFNDIAQLFFYFGGGAGLIKLAFSVQGIVKDILAKLQTLVEATNAHSEKLNDIANGLAYLQGRKG